MTPFLVDANVIVYAVSASELGERCRQILADIAGGEAEGRCSTAVLEEVWHLELSGRIAALEGQTRRAHSLFDPLLTVSHHSFGRALDLESSELGANDRLHVATCIDHQLQAIVSADRGFDRVDEVDRVDPFDRAGFVALLDAG